MSDGYVMLNAYTADGDLIGTGADLQDGVPFSPAPDGGFELARLPTSNVMLEISWNREDDDTITWWYDLADSYATRY